MTGLLPRLQPKFVNVTATNDCTCFCGQIHAHLIRSQRSWEGDNHENGITVHLKSAVLAKWFDGMFFSIPKLLQHYEQQSLSAEKPTIYNDGY